MSAAGKAGEALARLRQDRALAVGAAVAAVWLLLVLGFAIFGPATDAPRTGWERVGTLAAVLVPLALIALAVGTARSLAALRAEAEALRAMLAALQEGRPAASDAAAAEPLELRRAPSRAAMQLPGSARVPEQRAAEPRAAEQRAAEPPRQPRPAEPRRTAPPAARPAGPLRPPAQRPPDPQPSLDLGGPPPVPVDSDDLIRALNFPDGPDDAVAVQSLRAALRDPDTARLIRAAQDMVMLLATRGLYMDDRPAAPVRPDLWRRLAEGERGASLAGIITPSSPETMEAVGAALRGDEVFRDAAHHFLRHWDRLLTRELPNLDDRRVSALADTRSGRAFVLLAEAAGSLD